MNPSRAGLRTYKCQLTLIFYPTFPSLTAAYEPASVEQLHYSNLG
jgi:hypothetical protein